MLRAGAGHILTTCGDRAQAYLLPPRTLLTSPEEPPGGGKGDAVPEIWLCLKEKIRLMESIHTEITDTELPEDPLVPVHSVCPSEGVVLGRWLRAVSPSSSVGGQQCTHVPAVQPGRRWAQDSLSQRPPSLQIACQSTSAKEQKYWAKLPRSSSKFLIGALKSNKTTRETSVYSAE